MGIYLVLSWLLQMPPAEELVVEFARWLSPGFAVWCSSKIHELLIESLKISTPDYIRDLPDQII